MLNAFDELRGLSADGEKRLRVGMSVDPLLCYLASGARRLQLPLPAYPGDGGGGRPGRRRWPGCETASWIWRSAA
ncbi:hypothetical protein M8494_25195 [Serratia ureilytica]